MTVELLLAVGFAGAFIGLVGSIVLEASKSGALTQRRQRGHILGFHALHPYLRRRRWDSCDDPLHLRAGEVSFQPAGT